MLVKYYGENSYEDLRTMVLEGKWTVDEMTKLAKGMYYDLNGNSEVDIEDQFGFLSVQHNIDGFYFGAGGTTIERDSNNQAVLTIGDEHSIDIMIGYIRSCTPKVLATLEIMQERLSFITIFMLRQ